MYRNSRDVGLLFGARAAALRDRPAVRLLVDLVESRSADGFARRAV